MGQRAQIFIRIENPLKKEKLEGSLWNEDDRKEAKLYFGNKKYSVIPFHHQWLYGTTAIGMLVKIMKEVNLAKGQEHPFSPDLVNIPYTDNREKFRGYGVIEFVKAIISTTDFEVSEINGRFGVERVTYIGDEHYDYEKRKKNKGWTNHQEYCDCGDNNDGIMIIDVPSKKYCFMNISEQYKKDCASSSCLPTLQPVNAHDYQVAYYPILKKRLTSYTIQDNCNNDKEKIKELLTENREMAVAIYEITKEFGVLSLKEVTKMFPKTYKTFKQEQTKKKK